MLSTEGGFRFNLPTNYRDVKFIGDCQDGILRLVELIGWKVMKTFEEKKKQKQGLINKQQDEFMALMNKK